MAKKPCAPTIEDEVALVDSLAAEGLRAARKGTLALPKMEKEGLRLAVARMYALRAVGRCTEAAARGADAVEILHRAVNRTRARTLNGQRRR